MRKSTLWSSLGAAVLLAASSFSASAQTYQVKFLSPSPDVTEVTSEEMKKIVFQYQNRFDETLFASLQSFDKSAFEAGVTLVDQNDKSYPLLGYAMVQNNGTVVLGNDSPESQDLLTSSDVKQIAVTFGELPAGTYTLTIAEKIVKTGSFAFNATLNDGSGSHTWTIPGGGTVTPDNPLNEYTISPEAGSRIPLPPNSWTGYSFKVTFPAGEEFDDNGFMEWSNAVLKNKSTGKEYTATNGNNSWTGAGFTVIFQESFFGYPDIPAGEYELIIPEGFYKDNEGNSTPEIIADYTIGAAAPEFESQDPAYNASLPSISEMRLTYSAAVEIAADAQPMPVMVGGGTSETGVTATLSSLENDGKTVVVKFSENNLGSGQYYFTLPEGALYAAGDPDSKVAGDDYWFVIDVPFVMPELESSVPAANEAVESLTEIRLNYTAPVKFAAGKENEKQYIYKAVTYAVAGEAVATIENDGKTVVFAVTPKDGSFAPGNYFLQFSNQFLVAAEDESKAIGFTELPFQIVEAPVNPLTIFTTDPADNSEVSELSSVLLTFTELNSADGVEAASPATTVLLKNTTTGQTWGVMHSANGSNYAQRYMVFLNDANTQETVTVPGDYELVIPADTWYDYTKSSVRNEEIVLHYTIKEGVEVKNPFENYVVRPEDNTVKAIDRITLQFSGIMYGTVVDMNTEKKATLVNKVSGQTYEGTASFFEDFIGIDYSTVYINFNPAVTEYGDYTLNVEAGLLSLDGAESPAITRDFTIAYIPSPFRDWKVTPADGAEVESIDKVVLDFPFVTTDYYIGDSSTVTLTLKGTDTVIKANSFNIAYDQAISEDIIGKYEITFEPAVTTPGTWVLNVPAGMLNDYVDEESPEITAEFIVLANPFGTYTLNPANQAELKEINSVGILFSDIAADETVTFDESRLSEITLVSVDDDNDKSVAIALTQEATAEGKLVTVTFDKSGTRGKYHFTFPAGILTLGAQSNFAIEAYYNVDASGVALLVDENGTADVYDMTGRVILLNADAEALGNLENGLYIINGKKVIIRK